MGEREKKLESLGYLIDQTTPEGKLVDALSVVGSIVYASGQVPFIGDQLVSKGKVPSQISKDDATLIEGARRLCSI